MVQRFEEDRRRGIVSQHEASTGLGKKWYFLGFSLIFSVAGILSILFWHHIPLGVDFRGGTQVTVRFDSVRRTRITSVRPWRARACAMRGYKANLRPERERGERSR